MPIRLEMQEVAGKQEDEVADLDVFVKQMHELKKTVSIINIKQAQHSQKNCDSKSTARPQ